ncbi:surfeit locus protein 6 homolog [Aricia agestis]|uniref:surfeit locus protein 6 homolog n=1 Tax=Aricia agestis TaxID=91739 RepID=UPI001C203161|nr:surfeit locus protein 6 homolog [Aricia agestis]
MGVPKKPVKIKHVKNEIIKEMNFLKNIFSVAFIPLHKKDDSELMDFEMEKSATNKEPEKYTRANTIAELEAKLQKVKSQHKFQIKGKLAKKSLNSKLSKKLKKTERNKMNKKPKPIVDSETDLKETKEEKPKVNQQPKPVFNTDGKLVFSKFDFAKLGGKEKTPKSQKDPRKLLDQLKNQEQKIQQLSETDGEKAKEIKEKLAWKTILQKAEGEKVKDDPTLLKKSIKKMEQKKKVSKKKWENRIEGVEKKKQDRQTKRKDNISKKKKEKKAKVVKAAQKRGRVVI